MASRSLVAASFSRYNTVSDGLYPDLKCDLPPEREFLPLTLVVSSLVDLWLQVRFLELHERWHNT